MKRPWTASTAMIKAEKYLAKVGWCFAAGLAQNLNISWLEAELTLKLGEAYGIFRSKKGRFWLVPWRYPF